MDFRRGIGGLVRVLRFSSSRSFGVGCHCRYLRDVSLDLVVGQVEEVRLGLPQRVELLLDLQRRENEEERGQDQEAGEG